MALIRRFDRVTRDSQRVHGETECLWSSFSVSGQRVVQLDTTGSSTRKIRGKVSQAIQLDAEGARQLVAILTREFDL